jgi:hypothetical protein
MEVLVLCLSDFNLRDADSQLRATVFRLLSSIVELAVSKQCVNQHLPAYQLTVSD